MSALRYSLPAHSQDLTPAILQFEQKQFGGAERFMQNLVSQLPALGIQPVLVSLSSGESRFPVDFLGFSLAYSEQVVDELVALIQQRQIRVALTSSYRSEIALAARRCGIRHVWRVPSAPEVCLEMEQDFGAATRALGLLADCIVCPAEFIAQGVRAQGLVVEVVRNGIEQSFLAEDYSPRAAAPGVTVISSIGVIHPQKRHHLFIAAAERLHSRYRELKFRIFGNVLQGEGENYYRELLKQVQEAGLEGVLQFCHQQVVSPGTLLDTDIVVQCGVGEGFGNATAEALALGLPVVCTASGGHLELAVDRESALFVQADSVDEVVVALERLIAQADLRSKIAHGARERYKTGHSYSDCALAYAKLLMQSE